MAIGYQLLGKPVEGLDTSVFTTLSANLLAQEKERETQRQAWKTEQDALRKTQRDITATANQDANQFFGKFSQGIIDQSLDLQNQLETGQIRSSDYTAQWRNLNQSNEQMISAQKGYQEKAQKVVESVANQTASVGLAHNFAEFNKRFQPGKMSVEKDERGGLRLYNLETGQEVSPSYLNDLVNTELPKFDYTTAATTLVDSFGKRAFTAADGSFISGAIFNPGDTYSAVLSSLNPQDIEKLMKTEAESILAGSQAPTVSILLDGKGYETVYNRSELKKGENIYRKPDGTYEFADGDEEVAEDFMAEQLRNALPIQIKQPKEDKLNLFEKEQIRLQEARLLQSKNEGEDLPYVSNVNVIATEEGSDLAKTTIRGLKEDSLSEDNFEKTTEVITNVFNNQKFPSGATLNRVVGGEVYEPEQKKETISGKSTLTIPAKTKVDALELFIPDIMTEPIRIPGGKGFAKILDKIINLLDTRKKSGQPLGKEEFIKFFENQEVFERYNPIEQKDQTNVEVDATKKKFG